MSIRNRILLIVIMTLVLLAVFVSAAVAFWARPDRLSESQCKSLVLLAWKSANSKSLEGKKAFQINLSGKNRRIDAVLDRLAENQELGKKLRNVLPQREPDDEFFKNMTLRHTGRTMIAGRICEKVRISPAAYKGDSLELLTDSKTGYPLGWRRYDSRGRFIKGYTYRQIGTDKTGLDVPASGLEQEIDHERFLRGILEEELIAPEKVKDLERRGQISLPQWLPEGFKLIGARLLPRLETVEELREEGFGRGRGRMFGPSFIREWMKFKEGNFQVILSDGLNTISIIHFQRRQLMDQLLKPDLISSALEEKSREIERIFHTSMVGKVDPGALVLLFGGIDREELQKVLDSIPESKMEFPPFWEMFHGMPPMGKPPMFGGPYPDESPSPPDNIE